MFFHPYSLNERDQKATIMITKMMIMITMMMMVKLKFWTCENFRNQVNLRWNGIVSARKCPQHETVSVVALLDKQTVKQKQISLFSHNYFQTIIKLCSYKPSKSSLGQSEGLLSILTFVEDESLLNNSHECALCPLMVKYNLKNNIIVPFLSINRRFLNSSVQAEVSQLSNVRLIWMWARCYCS